MTQRIRPTSLAWFPYDVDEWEQLVIGATFEEETALHRAARQAWRDKDAPCTLVDTPSAWERLLGTRWRKLRTFLQRHFLPDPQHEGRFVWGWLLSLYRMCDQRTRWYTRYSGHRRGERRCLSPRVRRLVMARCEARCRHCRSTALLQVDHVVPISRGGTDDIANLQILCRTCNLRKSDRLESELGGRHG
jgi:5-methylcytosine-specific restriction protein A